MAHPTSWEGQQEENWVSAPSGLQWRLLKLALGAPVTWSGLGGGDLAGRPEALLTPSSSFVSLAQVHFFNSFFYDKLRTKGYDGVKRWTKNVSCQFTCTWVTPCL